MSSPLTPQQCDDIDAAITAYRQHPDIGFACCSAHPVADHVPALLATVRHLTSRVQELEADSAFLAALEAAGVDNWEGYDDAREAL